MKRHAATLCTARFGVAYRRIFDVPLIVLYAIFMKKSTHLTKKLLTNFGISAIIRLPPTYQP